MLNCASLRFNETFLPLKLPGFIYCISGNIPMGGTDLTLEKWLHRMNRNGQIGLGR